MQIHVDNVFKMLQLADEAVVKAHGANTATTRAIGASLTEGAKSIIAIAEALGVKSPLTINQPEVVEAKPE